LQQTQPLWTQANKPGWEAKGYAVPMPLSVMLVPSFGIFKLQLSGNVTSLIYPGDLSDVKFMASRLWTLATVDSLKKEQI
jgi:hypothetical protein